MLPFHMVLSDIHGWYIIQVRPPGVDCANRLMNKVELPWLLSLLGHTTRPLSQRAPSAEGGHSNVHMQTAITKMLISELKPEDQQELHHFCLQSLQLWRQTIHAHVHSILTTICQYLDQTV